MAMAAYLSVCFIASHPGPAEHMAHYAKYIESQGHEVHVYGSGEALKCFRSHEIRSIKEFSSDDPLAAAKIAEECAVANVAMTDVGHAFSYNMQCALAEKSPHTLRMAYYDNPESDVPGDYPEVALGVMKAAHRILFANPLIKDKVAVDVPPENKSGVGFYVVNVDTLKAARLEKSALRAKIFAHYGIEERGQRVLVYFGGNNKDYFEKAFPALVTILKEADLANTIIFLQQHPRAIPLGLDARQLSGEMIVSKESSETMQTLADGALYYQTTLAPRLALAGIPVIQIGHDPYRDCLVRGGVALPVTTAAELAAALEAFPLDISPEKILSALGYDPRWQELLLEALKH